MPVTNPTDALTIFASTADQRYLLGRDLFLRTHEPITTYRFRNGNKAAVTETALLQKLLEPPEATVGNRVFVLYAAPGSGKSELMRWLQTQIEMKAPDRALATIRIARTELDVLSIVERFQHLMSATGFDDLTHQRWQQVRQKPRTLSKLLVLSALESLLEADEEINVLYYRLLNAVHPYLERSLQRETGDEPSQMELLSLEDWEAIKAETALDIPISYERFRGEMLRFFRQHLLEGFELKTALSHISTQITGTHGVRPILLVDDLVQSLNLFATDLLDYLLTLEAGAWDVVLGLTPAAFEEGKRGRTLLQRIAHLDTIDDRVEKLWLSDEIGRESYVLSEENCHHFAARYLTEYYLWQNTTTKNHLYPFNQALLIRIFRGIPANKGKTRYFLRHLRKILAQIADGMPLLEAVAPYAHTEFVARTADLTLAAICELYGRLVGAEMPTTITLSAELAAQFNLSSEELTVPVEPLVKIKFSREAINEVVDDEEKAAVRDWLLGKGVNRQLLKRVRQGAARWLRAIQSPDRLHADHISRPNGVLWYRRTYLEVSLPILLEGVDDTSDGILISRNIGLTAFDLHNYATAKGANLKALTARLATEPPMIQFLLSGLRWRQEVMRQLETQLGMPVSRFALLLYSLWVGVEQPAEHALQQFSPNLTGDLLLCRQHYQNENPGLPSMPGKTICQVLDDFFKLRENVYDGPKIAALLAGETAGSLLEALLAIDMTAVDPNYRLGRQLLVNVLETAQTIITHRNTDMPTTPETLSPATQTVVAALQSGNGAGVPLSQMTPAVWTELWETAPDLHASLRVIRGK